MFSQTITPEIISTTGVNPPNNISTMKVYPNPANDYVIISTSDYSQMTNYTIRISNSLGQQVLFSQIDQQELQIDVNGFGGYGTYFIKIYDGSGNLKETRKLILL